MNDKLQYGLFEHPPHGKRETSRRAAVGAKKRAPAAWKRILGVIHNGVCGTFTAGMTDQQIEDATGLSGDTVRPRRGELLLGGMIRDSGRTRKTRAGNEAIVWEITDAGRLALFPKRGE